MKKINVFVLLCIFLITLVSGSLLTFDLKADPFKINMTIGNNTQNVSFPKWADIKNFTFSFGVDDLLLNAWYRLDNNPLDSIHGLHGKEVGDVNYGDGVYSTAALFNGTSGHYIELPPSDVLLPINNSWSVAMWINASSDNNDPYIFQMQRSGLSCQDALRVELNTPSFKLEVDYYTGTLTEFLLSETILPNTWYLLAVTHNGSAVNAYINGQLEASSTESFFRFGSNNATIGSNCVGGDAFNGKVDEVMIFNRSLTQSEVSFLHNNRVNEYYPSNLNVYVQDQLVLNYSGDFNQKVNYSTNVTRLNEVLDSDTDCCQITFDTADESILDIQLLNATYDFGIGNCTDSDFNFTLINFSYFDQSDQSPISITNNYDLTFSNIGISVNGSFSGSFSDSLCSNVNLTARGIEYDLTGQITGSKNLYGIKLIDITSPISITGTVVNYPISLIKLNESTTITFTWLTTTFQPISGTMLIYECLGNGDRTLISNNPIIDGETSDNLELLTKTYSYEVVINGETFTDSSSFTKCHIESSETRRYFVTVVETDVSPIAGLYGIPCNFTNTNNNEFFLEWGKNPQSSSVITGCVRGYTGTISNNTKFHEQCSTSFSLNSTVSPPGVPYIATAILFQNGFSIGCGGSFDQGVDKSTSDMFELMGIFSIFLLVISLAFLFASDGESMVIGAVVGVIISWFLGLLAFGWAGVSMITFLGLIIAIVGRYSRKRTQ